MERLCETRCERLFESGGGMGCAWGVKGDVNGRVQACVKEGGFEV